MDEGEGLQEENKESTRTLMSTNGTKNPLMIELILDEVFKYLPVDKLPNMRLVCNLWNIVVTRRIKETVNVYFSIDEKADFKKYEDIQRQIVLRQESFPFVALSCTELGVESLTSENRETIKTFFKTIGPYLRVMFVDYDCFNRSNQRLYGSLEAEDFNFKNLKNLTITIIGALMAEYFAPNMNAFAECLCHLLKACPILETLIIHSFLDSIDVVLTSEVALNLMSTLHDLNFQNLQNLTVTGCIITDSSLFFLSQMNLKLKKLGIVISYRNTVSNDSIYLVLSSLSKTLKDLEYEIDENSESTRSSKTFPLMEELEKMVIRYHRRGPHQQNYQQFPNFSYAKKFPNLSKFKLVSALEHEDEFFGDLMEPTQVVVDLKLPRDLKALNEKLFSNISTIFPNLKKLAISTRDAFESIANWLRVIDNLQELTIKPFVKNYNELTKDYYDHGEECCPCRLSFNVQKIKTPGADIQAINDAKYDCNQSLKSILHYSRRLKKLKTIKLICDKISELEDPDFDMKRSLKISIRDDGSYNAVYYTAKYFMDLGGTRHE